MSNPEPDACYDEGSTFGLTLFVNEGPLNPKFVGR